MGLNLPSFGNPGWTDPFSKYLSNEKSRHENEKLGIEAEFARPNAQQELMSKELANVFQNIRNKHEEPRLQAEIGNTNAQAGLFGAQTRNQNAQAQALNYDNQVTGAFNPMILEMIKQMQNQGQNRQQGPQQGPMSNPFQGQAGQNNAPQQQARGPQINDILSDPILGPKLSKILGLPTAESKLTGTQKELASLYGYNSPKYKQALAQSLGIVEGANVPDGAVPLRSMSPGERNSYTKEARTEQKFVQGQVKVNRIANQMKSLIEKHPNMADDFAAAIVGDEKERGTMLTKLKRKGVDKSDLAAFEKFSTLSNDLVLKQSESTGRNATDSRMEIIGKSKPNAANTDEANHYLIDRILYETEPAKPYNQALKHAFENRYAIPLDIESYRGKQPEHEAENLAHDMATSSSNGAVAVRYLNGVKLNIPQHEVAEFDKEHPNG